MKKEVDHTMGVILKEFEIIKNSLKPVLEEIKKVKETKIELDRTKKDLDARLKKIDFEIRRISQRPETAKDLSVLKDKVELLQKELMRIKASSSTNVNEIKKIIRAIVAEEEILTDVQKSNISRLKKTIEELDKNHLKLISATREKIAGVLTELSKSNEHKEQIVSELNKHKKAILKLNDENKKTSDKLANIATINSRLEKKQNTESGDIKNRIYKLEKKMITQAEFTELKNSLNLLKEKIFGEVGSLKHQFGLLEKRIITKKELDSAVKTSMTTENVAINQAVKDMKELVKSEGLSTNEKMQKINAGLSKELELLKNSTKDIANELERISIKVENTSKIMNEMEKVL